MCVPRSLLGFSRHCLHTQLVCLSWYLLAVSFLLFPHTPLVAHEEAAVKFKQQRLGCFLVPVVLELKSPGWAYWVKTHRQCTSATICDAVSGALLFPALGSSSPPVLFLRFSFSHSVFCSGPACLPSPPFSFPSSALSNAALQRHWLTGDAAAWAEEMEGGRKRRKSCSQQRRQQKHWKTSFLPEVNPSRPLLGQQIRMWFLSQFSERTLTAPCTLPVCFQGTELRFIAQIHQNLDWFSRMGD